MELEVDGRALRGEFLRSAKLVNTMIEQLSVFTSEVTRSRARGRHRGQARRPGPGAGRFGCVERPHRIGQPDGRQPDRAGAQYRRGDDRRGRRRPVQEDHGRRAWRDLATQGGHQHDGRPASFVRVRSHARGPRGWHRRAAGRAGGCTGCRRHLERPHRLGQRDGVEPDRAGPQYRRRDHRRRPRRPVAQDHRRRQGRDSRAQGNHQHDGRPVERVSHRKSRAWLARSAPRVRIGRPGGGARRRGHLERPHGLGQLDGVEPDGPGSQYRRGHDGRRQGRPEPQDHRGREG